MTTHREDPVWADGCSGRGASLRARPRPDRLRLDGRPRRSAHSTTLARRVEELGFRRYWVAEHHGMPGIASSSPAVLDRPPRRGDDADPGRFRRGDAAQPPATGRRRAVRDAGGAAPGPDRPRASAGRRAPTRARPRRCAAAPARWAPTTSPSSSRSWPPTSAATVRSWRCPAAGNRPGDLVARVERLQRPGRRACWGCRSRSPTTSARRTRCRRWRCTGRPFRPSALLEQPYAMVGRLGAGRADPMARPAGWRCPGRCSSCGCARASPGLLPDRRGGRSLPLHTEERRFVEDRLAGQVIGAPSHRARRGRTSCVERTAGDELMVVTTAHDGADRLRSYELLAGGGRRRPASDAVL